MGFIKKKSESANLHFLLAIQFENRNLLSYLAGKSAIWQQSRQEREAEKWIKKGRKGRERVKAGKQGKGVGERFKNLEGEISE